MVSFDPHMRNDLQKVLWITTCLDDSEPWAEFILDEMLFNLDVSGYIQARRSSPGLVTASADFGINVMPCGYQTAVELWDTLFRPALLSDRSLIRIC